MKDQYSCDGRGQRDRRGDRGTQSGKAGVDADIRRVETESDLYRRC